MKTEIQPGQTVATFALPLPMDAVPAIGELIKRIYGTGDTNLGLDGGSMRIVAPADGFGPMKRGRGPAAVSIAEDMMSTYIQLRNGELKMTVSDQQNQVLVIAEVMSQWFTEVGGVNYVELAFQIDGEDTPWIFTLQRKDGETPHDKRAEAEARIAELEAELAELKAVNV